MSYFKNDGLLVNEYSYDFAVDGGATGAYDLSAKANKADLPTGAVVQAVKVKVVEALVGSGASAAIGTSAASGAYKANAAASAYSLNAVFDFTTLTAIDAANKADLLLTVGGAPLTAGKLKIMVEFLNPGA